VQNNLEHSAFTAREAESLGPWLQAQGYYTGFIGKYLNRYLADEAVPPGWDEFRARVWNADGTMIGDGYTSFSLREYWHEGPQTHNEVVEYPNPSSVDDLVKRVWDAVDDAGSGRTPGASSLGQRLLLGRAPALEKAPRVRGGDSRALPLRRPRAGAGEDHGSSGREHRYRADLPRARRRLTAAGLRRPLARPTRARRDAEPPVQPDAHDRELGQRRYTGLRTNWWKYIRWPSGREELYDFELQNLAHRQAQAYRLARMREALDVLANA
jgi:hypothetical protein